MRSLTRSGASNFAACISMIALTFIVLLLRLAIKFSRKQAVNGADVLCILSCAVFYSYCGFMINYILNVSKFGTIDASLQVGFEELRNLSLVSYILENHFGVTITLVKLSILRFYYSVFGITRFSNNIIGVTGAICIVWFLIAQSLVIFQCVPIHKYWDGFTIDPTCLNGPKFLLGYETSNLFLDVMILSIPIPIVWKLHMPASNRVAVLGVFLLGAFTCVASIVRLHYIWINGGKSINVPDSLMWSTIQLGLAIICSCLPLFGPLLTSCLSALRVPYASIRSWTRRVLRTQSTKASSQHSYKMGIGGYAKTSSEQELTDVSKSTEVSERSRTKPSMQSWVESNQRYQGQHPLASTNNDAEKPQHGVHVNREIHVC